MHYLTKNAPEIQVTVTDGRVSAEVEVFQTADRGGDNSFPTRITLRHSLGQIGMQLGDCDGSITFYVVGHLEAGDLVRLLNAAVRAVERSGIPQISERPQ
jgi:hypothetical protein